MIKKKNYVVCITIILIALLMAYILTISYFPKVEQEDGNIVSPATRLRVYSTFSKLPNDYRAKIREENWKIEILDGTIEDTFGIVHEEDITGLTRVNDRTIYIENTDVLLHELCHACLFDIDTGSSFYIFYDEMEEEMKYSKLNKYNRSAKDEYITESMAVYLINNESLHNLPYTEAAVKEILSNRYWRINYE